MTPRSLVAILVSGALLAGCAGGGGFVSRNAQANTPLFGSKSGADVSAPLNPSYRVTEVDVTVPPELTVSEANGIKPRADILWQEEPLGDRYAQVDAILTDAIKQGVAGMDGPRAVKIEAVVTRFHALTKRTRYTYGGDHEIWMVMSVRDAETGELLEPGRLVGFDSWVSSEQALADEAQGIFQRDEITALVSDMIRNDLTQPRDAPQG
ncbi:MAG: hypothetical protein AUK37_09405 [Rhodobacterales bacterium CG2_30_65_12]|nr:MAG: hypothetical protein AUK37_09405 [Rhodobacterales bacterium CG2_30_65_12]